MKRTLLVGFTGPSGSGKTTLAKWLAETKRKFENEEVEVLYFEGSASLTHTPEQRKYLEETYAYEPKGHQNVINLSSQNPDFGYDFQNLLLEGRHIRLKEFYHDNIPLDTKARIVVTDRTFIDIAVYSALQCAHNIDDARMNDLLARAKYYQNLFDITFMVKPNMEWTEDNGSRVANNFYQNNVVYPICRFMGDSLHDVRSQDLHYINEWDLDQRKKQVDKVLSYRFSRLEPVTGGMINE